MITMEELLTVEDVASMLRKSEETIKRMLRKGEIRGFKVGIEWRVNPSDLRKYLEEQMAKQQLEDN